MYFLFVKSMFRLKAICRITTTSLPAQELFPHNPGSPHCSGDCAGGQCRTLGHKLSKDIRKGNELVSNSPQCCAYLVDKMGDKVCGEGVWKGHI